MTSGYQAAWTTTGFGQLPRSSVPPAAGVSRAAAPEPEQPVSRHTVTTSALVNGRRWRAAGSMNRRSFLDASDPANREDVRGAGDHSLMQTGIRNKGVTRARAR